MCDSYQGTNITWRTNLQVFQQYAGILQQKYPDLSIRGDNFPPGGFRLQTAQILSVIKFLVIMMVLARWTLSIIQSLTVDSALTRLLVWVNLLLAGLSGCLTTRFTPAWWPSSSSTVMIFCQQLPEIICFYPSAVETQLISTGAFEITLNDMPVKAAKLHSRYDLPTIHSLNMTLPPFSGLVQDWGWQNTSAWRTLPNHRESDEHEGDPTIVS